MSHYYSNDQNLNSRIKEISYDFKGVRVNLKTNLGVFSKDRVDFGTNVLLNSIDEDLDNKQVLDVGCGYGIIGLSIAKKYINSKVHLVDVNERAVELAKQNSISNKINNASIYVSNVFENVKDKFDFIITNPPIRAGKVIVHNIVLGSYELLNSGGATFVVIQKKQGSPSLIKEMEGVFDSVEIVDKKNGYNVIKGMKN